MANQPTKIYSSADIIQTVLNALGIQRTNLSEYETYTVDGKLLRVRVSDHGVNLSAWYRNNQNEDVPLTDSDNIALAITYNLTSRGGNRNGCIFYLCHSPYQNIVRFTFCHIHTFDCPKTIFFIFWYIPTL